MNELSGVSAAAPTPVDGRSAALRHAATEFESMFVELLLKSADLPLGGGESTTPIYGDMAMSAWSSELGESGGFGIADVLVRALGRLDEEGAAAETTSSTLAEARYRAQMEAR